MADATPQAIIITGGLRGFDDTHGTVAGEAVRRKPGETPAAFEARLLEVAQAARVDSVTIGGLPW